MTGARHRRGPRAPLAWVLLTTCLTATAALAQPEAAARDDAAPSDAAPSDAAPSDPASSSSLPKAGPPSEPSPAASQPPAPAEPRRLSVVVLDLKPTNAPPETARLVTDLVAVSLQRTRRLEVLTSEDVRSVMAFEAERQAAGCDDASCLAELAGALGASLVVHGSVGQLGDLFVVNLNLFDSHKARSVGRESAHVEDRSQLPDTIDRLTLSLVSEFLELEPAPASVSASAPSPFLSPLFLGGVGVAGLAGAGAVGLGLWATVIDGAVATPKDFGAREQEQQLGLGVIAGAGGLALVSAAALVAASLPLFE